MLTFPAETLCFDLVSKFVRLRRAYEHNAETRRVEARGQERWEGVME